MLIPDTSVFQTLSRRCLTPSEASAIKATIARFISNPDVPLFIAGLNKILATPEKAQILKSIGSFMPPRFRKRYIDGISSNEDRDDEDADDYEQEDFSFLAPRSSCATALGPSPTTAKSNTRITQVTKLYDSPMNAGVVATAPQKLAEKIDFSGNENVPMSGFLMGALTRQQAEDILADNGLTDGLFLVRKKNDSTRSFKVKPGERMPTKSWALSFVQGGVILHDLITQSRPGDALILNSRSLRGRDWPTLVGILKRDPHYNLSMPVFQAQSWYHGSISREVAEQRLAAAGPHLYGRYLVRKSSKGHGTYVVSMLEASEPGHKTATLRGKGWISGLAPDVIHSSFHELLQSLPLSQYCNVPKLGR